MNQPVITSFGKCHWYLKGIERLKKSCDQFGVKCTPFLNYPIGSPTHEQIPYAFKVHCIKALSGYHDVILWADSSAWLMNDPKPIFDIIKEQGYIIFDNFGNNNAHWCNDRQLWRFNFTRDEAEKQKHVVGGLFGIDFSSEIGNEIFNQYKLLADLFKGEWSNKNLTESIDPRCQGSRHDQSILSLIAAQRGLTITDQNKFFTFDPTQKDCIFALQGM